jgi:hypothetical protein
MVRLLNLQGWARAPSTDAIAAELDELEFVAT